MVLLTVKSEWFLEVELFGLKKLFNLWLGVGHEP